MSTGPTDVGVCRDDIPTCASVVNAAQRSLVFAREAGDEGWWGSFAEVSFNNVSRSTPYITLPREIARIEAIDVCDCPVQLNNQFYEYLRFGNGRMPKLCPNYRRWNTITQAMTRDNAITFSDPTLDAFYIRIYATSEADVQAGRRVLVQGIDTTGEEVRSQDGLVQVSGEFVALSPNFVQTNTQFKRLTGFQKDQTTGPIQIFQVDPDTGDETLLSVMQPTETVAGYRRYYMSNLPCNCCGNTGAEQTLRVTAIVKLELIPAQVDTDYLLIQNLEAMIEEAQSRRLMKIDNADAKRMAVGHHITATRMLNAEIAHYLGKQNPAIRFSPFGSARLERQQIGTML